MQEKYLYLIILLSIVSCASTLTNLGSSDFFEQSLFNSEMSSYPTFPIRMKGITFTDDKYCPEVPYDSKEAFYSLKQLASTGANYVSIVVTFYQKYHNSTVIFPIYTPIKSDYYTYVTATDEALTRVINYAHQIGLQVMLKPHIDLIEDPLFWRGDIGKNFTQTQWNKWFASYTDYILHFARMSEKLQVEMYSLSCELIEVSTQTQHWIKLIGQVREVYTGILTDSSNWGYLDGRGGEDTHKDWWGYVDVIGIDSYYPLAQDIDFPTVNQVVDAWQPVLARFKNLTEFFNRPIMVSEIGYCSGQCKRDYIPIKQDFTKQAIYYQAAFEAFRNVDFPFYGYFWWSWNTDPRDGGRKDNCITPQFKKAEEVLRHYYGGRFRLPKLPGPPVCDCTV
ncbi:hypothetical protein ABPG72_003183 [Tetrahymena utriculariae]